VEQHDTEQPTEDTEQPEGGRQDTREHRESLPRLAWQTADVARSLGMRPDALRRLCERRAVGAADGTLVVCLEHGIVGEKRGGRTRWRFLVPRSLLGAAADSEAGTRGGHGPKGK
jgi:hypothetical protein